MKRLLLMICLTSNVLFGMYDAPSNGFEKQLVKKVKRSLQKALELDSQLTPASPYLEHFLNNLNSLCDVTAVEGNALTYDKSLLPAYVNVFIYRDNENPQEALTYFDDTFSEIFVCVFENMSDPNMRESTFKTFQMLDYTILFEERIPLTGYIAVIRKSDSFFSD